jgi:hypothetical protein
MNIHRKRMFRRSRHTFPKGSITVNVQWTFNMNIQSKMNVHWVTSHISLWSTTVNVHSELENIHRLYGEHSWWMFTVRECSQLSHHIFMVSGVLSLRKPPLQLTIQMWTFRALPQTFTDQSWTFKGQLWTFTTQSWTFKLEMWTFNGYSWTFTSQPWTFTIQPWTFKVYREHSQASHEHSKCIHEHSQASREHSRAVMNIQSVSWTFTSQPWTFKVHSWTFTSHLWTFTSQPWTFKVHSWTFTSSHEHSKCIVNIHKPAVNIQTCHECSPRCLPSSLNWLALQTLTKVREGNIIYQLDIV